VREIADGTRELAPQKTQLVLTPLGLDGVQFTLTYGVVVSVSELENAVINRLVLEVLELCERLGVRLAERAVAPAE